MPVTLPEAVKAARELKASVNGGNPYNLNELSRGIISRDDYDLSIVSDSLISRLSTTPPDIRTLRNIWNTFLELKEHPVLKPWLEKYGRGMVRLFQSLTKS